MSKELFKNQDYSIGNHVPSTGLGCFDAKYSPRSGKMEVTVTACPRFTSGAAMRFDETQEQQYLKTFIDFIPVYWNNKFKFSCTKRDWTEFTIEPTFKMEIKKNITDAHYDLKIQGTEQGNIAVRKAFDIDNPVEEHEKNYVRDLKFASGGSDDKFAQYRGKQSALFNLNAIKANIATQSTNMLNAIAVPVVIALNSGLQGPAQFSVAAMERLRTVARDVEYVFQQFAKPKLTITAPSKDDAEKLGTILRQFGCTSSQTYVKGGPSGKATIAVEKAAVVKARAKIQQSLVNFAEFAQYAAVHEYGHMLGLPDEYMCCGLETVGLLAQKGMAASSGAESQALTGNTTTQQQAFSASINQNQQEFIKLCSAAGLVPPSFGRSNPSLMSSGQQFLHVHAVTVWKALTTMTKGHVEAKEWRIDLK